MCAFVSKKISVVLICILHWFFEFNRIHLGLVFKLQGRTYVHNVEISTGVVKPAAKKRLLYGVCLHAKRW